ncbi:MAG: YraN family protein [Cellvibrionaceae bacterium]|nr:YraN family protein [Cellvibrionaceae bacterium]
MRRSSDSRSTGAGAEALAADYLRQRGLKLIQRNYHCRHGELDLIMRAQREWVFVEVRARSPSHYSSAIESIGPHKRRKLIASAEYFLQQRGQSEAPCRFDVVAVLLRPGRAAEIEWLDNAFDAGDVYY